MAIIKYQYYDTGYDEEWRVEGDRWVAQLFTPAITHRIRKVKIQIRKVGAPTGNLTVEIQGVSGGHPDGSAVASGTLATADIGGTTLMHTITLGEGAILTATTQYAIVVDVRNGDDNNYIYWYEDSTSPTYTGGHVEGSTSSGSSWTSYTTKDFMFEEWGNAATGLEVFPVDDVARASSIRHIFRPGFFRMQVGLGDLGFDVDVAEASVRSELEQEYVPLPGAAEAIEAALAETTWGPTIVEKKKAYEAAKKADKARAQEEEDWRVKGELAREGIRQTTELFRQLNLEKQQASIFKPKTPRTEEQMMESLRQIGETVGLGREIKPKIPWWKRQGLVGGKERIGE